MSAEVLGSVSAAGPQPAASPILLVEPSLVNRLLAVAVAVFAVPALLVLHAALAADAGAPSLPALAGTLAGAAPLAAGFGWILHRSPRASALRAGRALCAALAAETSILALALLARLL
jgi:hypothetical protein